MSSLYKIIPFIIRRGTCGGALVQFQAGLEDENALPFEIGKVLVTTDMQPDDVRGNHAHYETEEIVVALCGGCTFELDDGRGAAECVRLDAGGSAPPSAAGMKDALLLYPHVWRTIRNFKPGTILLIVASMRYEESDYIRDRSDFERLAGTWSGLGGSSESG